MMKEKIKKTQRGFIQIPLLIGIIVSIVVSTGVGYGVIEYSKTSNLVKKAEQLTGGEKYQEAIKELNLAQISWFVNSLGIKKQEISNEIEKNKKLVEDKSKYEQGLDKLNKGNLQAAIGLLSQFSESSFYYQKAQTKVEEAKRKMIEGELFEEKVARKEAEQKTKRSMEPLENCRRFFEQRF